MGRDEQEEVRRPEILAKDKSREVCARLGIAIYAARADDALD